MKRGKTMTGKTSMTSAVLSAVLVYVPVVGFAQDAQWRVESSSAAILEVSKGFSIKGPESASALQARVAERLGVLSIDTRVDTASLIMSLELSPVSVKALGVYGAIFNPLSGAPLTVHELEASSRVAQAAARNNNETLQVSLGQASEGAGTMPLDVDSAPSTDPRCSGSGSFSSYGQRYSGRDIVSVSVGCRVGYETSVQINASRGLSNWTKDSRGGHYNSYGVEVEHVFPWSISTTRYSETDYLTGGPLLALGQGGHVRSLSQEFAKPLSVSGTLIYSLGWTEQTSSFSSVGLDDKTSYYTGMIGYSWRKDASQANVKLQQGLTGRRSFNVTPLSGLFDPHFTALSVDARTAYKMFERWSAEFYGAAQVSSKGAPAAVQFYAGGLDRGRAFTPGNIAGPSGLAGSAAIVHSVTEAMSAYGGIDGGVSTQVVGRHLRESSAFVGTRGQMGKAIAFDIAYAAPLSAPQGVQKSGRVLGRFNIDF